jgi:hypothetical protein
MSHFRSQKSEKEKDLFDNIYRFNPVFSIASFTKLTKVQKRNYEPFIKNKRYSAFLHAPAEAKLTVKVINRDLAHFLWQLKKPQTLTCLLQKRYLGTREQKEQFIIQLLLSSVIEVQLDGNFLSGIAAANRMLSKIGSGEIEHDRNGDKNYTQVLSDEAISFALKSPRLQPRDVSVLLYSFNQIPLSKRWQTNFPSESSVSQFLDLQDDGSWSGMPDGVHVKPIRRGADGKPVYFDLYWRVWQFSKRKHSKIKPRYKVYFSPLPRDLPEIFRNIRDLAVYSEAHAMKIGRNLPGILRADKFIVYFSKHQDALDFAREASKKTQSHAYQGIPFTFQIDSQNALVTLGVDPPAAYDSSLSWRLYIVNKLGLAIQNTRRIQPADPLLSIRSYMSMMGVDSLHWCPTSKDWTMVFQIK